MEITEQKLKTILKEQKDDFKNYTGLLAEHFEDQVKVIAEDVVSVKQKLDKTADKLDKVADRLDFVAELVAKNTEDIEIIKTDVEFIKHSLKRKVDIEEFAALEKRVLILERNR